MKFKDKKEKNLIKRYIKEKVNIKYNMEKKEEYYRNFMEKNKEKLHTSITCDICYGSYTYFNRSRHNKGSRHMRALEKKEKEENLIK
jgi:hypothetical protein